MTLKSERFKVVYIKNLAKQTIEMQMTQKLNDTLGNHTHTKSAIPHHLSFSGITKHHVILRTFLYITMILDRDDDIQ